ncbi:peptide ABC transporter substrate-binding protein [Clostridium sp.]|uniref:peptide ABC transporter substrate-binding protein n=1 Tax=Clostridium sp. TaxID=1506 RepID=UPI002FC88B1D
MKKLFYIIFILGIIICSISVEKENKDQVSSDFITYNLGVKPNNLIMTSSYNIREKDLLVALFQGLVTEDMEGEITPSLAKEYKISEDGLEYTFILKENLKYSDGEKITSEEFLDFFKSFLEDKSNIYASQLYCIFGAKDFAQGKVGFDNVAINAKDKNTLVIRLNYKSPYFIKILCEPVYVLRDYKELGKGTLNYKNVKYTGPFAIEKIYDNGDFGLIKNDMYYNSNEVTDEKIKVTFVEDEEKALASFELNDKNNSVDIMTESPINEYLRLSQEGKIRGFSSSTVYYLNFNIHSDNLIGDINFRNALNTAFSKEYYAQQISKDFAKPASLYVPKDNSMEKSFDTYGNKEKGIEYLKKTTFTGQEKIILVYEENSSNKRVAEDLSKNISQDLQIDIICKGYKDEILDQVIQKGEYDIYLSKFTPIFNDLSLYYELWDSKARENKIKYNNSYYDELVRSVKYEIDEEKRASVYKKCEELLKNDLPAVPIYYANTQICIKPNIYGVYASSSGNIRLEYISVDK